MKKETKPLVTDEIKRVYNDHLIVSRSFHRQPFRLKKNFDKFEEDNRFKYYAKLAKWFRIHPEINRTIYFEATLFFHKDEKVVPIKEYCKSKSLTNYVEYVKILSTLELDNPKSLQRCVDGFKYIKTYCEEVGINVTDYIQHKETPNSHYVFLKHVKQARVSIYSLFPFMDFFDILKTLYRDSEVWLFYLEDLSPNFYLKRYENSVKYKQLATQALTKVCQAKQ